MRPSIAMRLLGIAVVLAPVVAACGDDATSGSGVASTIPSDGGSGGLVTVPPFDPPDGEPLVGPEAQELAREYGGTTEAEGFVRTVREVDAVGFLGELDDFDLLAYGFDLLLREAQLTERIMAAEDEESDIEAVVDLYIDDEVARLGARGFTSPDLRRVVVAVREAFYRLQRLVDSSASALDCPENDRGFVHGDPDPSFAGYPSGEEAAAQGSTVGWDGDEFTGTPVFSHEDGDAQVWNLVDDGLVVAEVYVVRHGDGWFPSNVIFCSGAGPVDLGGEAPLPGPEPSDDGGDAGAQIHHTDGGVRSLEDGRHLVYIRGVESGGTDLLVDLAVWFEGEDANSAAAEDGDPDVPVPGDFYIRNLDPTVLTVPAGAPVAVTSVWFDPASDLQSVAITYDEFVAVFSGGASGVSSNLLSSPWWITIESGSVVALDEQYVP